MKRLFGLALLGSFSLFSAVAPASDDVVRGAIESLVPGAKIDSITETVLPNMYEVSIDGRVVYVSADGKYLLQGSIYDIANKIDLTEASRAGARKQVLGEIKDGFIVFAPENPKYSITVFTDIDCGYCRKLHGEIQAYNDAGIEVKYLFFPRAGVGSPSFAKAEAVWCAADQRKAMTDAKAGVDVPSQQCTNPIAEQYALGQRAGVNGTPAIFTPDGDQLGGYVPAAQLRQRLDQLSAK
ncbi:MAG: Thiol:disulfide interchange protein DsbC precursor [Alphaproteobacteria bacterium ADurb.BinA280]|jgi:thiol:disulfide interchange protein DsbC|nr:DsbC family protein [Xanthomonadales bacterium]MCC6507303.1 DsbC family protein [Aquimonas sp.]OPZ12815.1 MAG: Thiol:disulfide interchange protein DsbC precursor [Alphaproteobacteria bacterium ADurb.BinA280]